MIFEADFHEVEGKWHLFYVHDYRRKLFTIDSSQAADCTNRVLNIQKPIPLEKGEKMYYDTGLFNYPVAYDPEFWKNYNAPLESDEEKRIKAALMK